MNAIFTSKLLKTALAFSVTFWAGTETFAQGNKNQVRTTQNISNIFSSAGQTGAKVSAMVSRPGNSQDFEAAGSGTWQHMSNSAYAYDAQGRLTQRWYTDPVTGQNLGRTIITYNAQGEEIEYRMEQWQGASWVIMDAYRSQITYNPQGKKLETISQIWNSNTNSWENDFREQYTYDANNLVADITNAEWDNSSWNFLDRMILDNTGGTATSLVVQEYTGNSWQNLFRAQNVVWQVLYETPSSYVMQFDDSGVWVNGEKYTAIYDPNGGHVGVYEEWNPQIIAWEKTYRETESFDVNQNFTSWKNESWDPASNVWTLDGEERHLLTYAGIDVTERVFQDSWGSTTGTLTDREKEVYSNFQVFNVSGIKKNLPELAVTVFPNPSSNLLTISLPEQKGNVTANLTDVTGKTLLSKTFKATDKNQLNLENLPKGIYLLKVQSETGAAVKRIVKQ